MEQYSKINSKKYAKISINVRYHLFLETNGTRKRSNRK